MCDEETGHPDDCAQAADFLSAAGEGHNAAPTFRDALLTDYVTDAVLQSAGNRSWVKVGEPQEAR